MVLTLKITLLMREKQLADLRDHGADTDNIIRREDLPETNDLMKLWDAKIHNDVKIDITTFCVIFNTFYAMSCFTSVYGAIVRCRRIILISGICCFVALLALGFIIFFGTYFYTGTYVFQIKEEGIKVTGRNDCYQTTVAWSILAGTVAYSFLAACGHNAAIKYYFELVENPSLSTCGSMNSSINEITDNNEYTSKRSWTLNPIKAVVQSIKYMHSKFELTKPTVV
ncbi:uncharacterized protein LOC123294796 [Chrysoperla carnea]|uniref:uncharacterized protein LOC123294796 n=1 Tax=Chrysoperla carnea TaxID=189513 RepID=UPI001D06FC73|nr:uncharacterized protein LOC123294796 [Chrysoperla carnea]